ncbi:MAG: hypothetical protein ACFFKA_20055 [Candidatus Thorarchaeota archaeon]
MIFFKQKVVLTIYQIKQLLKYANTIQEKLIRKINRITKETFNKALGTHFFRRTYTSFLLNEDHTLNLIKQSLGNSDIKTLT